MKVLWLTNIILPEIANQISAPKPCGGGWIVGMANQITRINDVSLSVCFPIMNSHKIITGKLNNIAFYGFPNDNALPTVYNEKVEICLKKIINKAKPDIIHIYGTEYPHTLAMVRICEKLRIADKVVINLQGLCSIISQHYLCGIPIAARLFPSVRDVLKNDGFHRQSGNFMKRGTYEIEALKKVKYFIGRTDWDRACSNQINPSAKYFFCNEILRDEFYKHEWCMQNCEKHSIFISQAAYPVKGFHFLLQALPVIIDRFPDTQVYVAGQNFVHTKQYKWKNNSFGKYILKLIKKYHLEDYVTFTGSLDEKEMCERYIKSNVFVSPSSIENSPNSVGEAMLLGVPVVSSDVGGVKNLLTHGKEGFLYQHDAPYMLAHYVCEIFANDELALKFSNNARERAKITHNKEANVKTLIDIYNQILEEK